jgi:hypothetical protein
MGGPTLGGILVLCMPRNQRDLRKYLELHQFGCYSLLKFDLPDISAEPVWGTEGVKDSKRWPRLPSGTMAAGDPVRTTPEEFGSDLSPEEQRFYQEMRERPEEEWSRRERRGMRELMERLSSKISDA